MISFTGLDILIISLCFTMQHYCSNKLAQKIIVMFLHREYIKQRAIVPGLEGVFFYCFSFPYVFSIEANPECSVRSLSNWEPSGIALLGCGLTWTDGFLTCHSFLSGLKDDTKILLLQENLSPISQRFFPGQSYLNIATSSVECESHQEL